MEDLKKKRKALGLTQQEMAVAAGVSLSTYRLWEYGVPPNPENETRLKEVLRGAEEGHAILPRKQ